jgi:WXG100 family type VII secretion target
VSIVVALSELAGVVDRMAAFDRAVEAQLEVIDAQLRVLAATWRGPAVTAYLEAHAAWTRDLLTMRAAVTGLRSHAATAHGNYHAAVTANRTMWR